MYRMRHPELGDFYSESPEWHLWVLATKWTTRSVAACSGHCCHRGTRRHSGQVTLGRSAQARSFTLAG